MNTGKLLDWITFTLIENRKSIIIIINPTINYWFLYVHTTLNISHRIDLEIQIHHSQGRSSIINNLFDCLSQIIIRYWNINIRKMVIEKEIFYMKFVANISNGIWTLDVYITYVLIVRYCLFLFDIYIFFAFVFLTFRIYDEVVFFFA